MENYIDNSRIHDGHRSRMRAKLLAYEQRIFDTYELLEMLLYHTITYKDTNPIAKRLLRTFGCLDGVLSARADSLIECEGVGVRTADFLTKVGRLGNIIGAEMLSDARPDLSGYDTAGRYIAEYFKDVHEKQVIALYLDNGMHLKAIEKLYDLEYESGGVKPKAFIDGAIKHSATVVITAHNHPFGPFYPTLGDRATNKAITEALAVSGIVHAEHYIICGEHYAGIGVLSDFSAKLSQTPALTRFVESRKASVGYTVSSPKQASISFTGYNITDLDYFTGLLGFVSNKGAEDRAEALLMRYHTIENVFTATVKELTDITDEKHAFYLKLLAYITSRRKTDLYRKGKIYTKAEIAEYLKAVYLGESVEKICLIAFDEKNRFIGCRLIGEGTVGASEVMPRKAVDCALTMGAKRVSVAHNHPFGTTDPSSDDINVTKLFGNLFAGCDIEFSDHYIVAGQLCDIIEI